MPKARISPEAMGDLLRRWQAGEKLSDLALEAQYSGNGLYKALTTLRDSQKKVAKKAKVKTAAKKPAFQTITFAPTTPAFDGVFMIWVPKGKVADTMNEVLNANR